MEASGAVMLIEGEMRSVLERLMRVADPLVFVA